MNPNDIRVAVIGPPGSGKSTIADHISKTTGAVKITSEKWEDVKQGIEAVDNNGYVLDGFPKTRMDCIKLQESGHLLVNLIELNGPKDILYERQLYKKEDPETGTFYHPVLNWTDDQNVIDRLIESNKDEQFESEFEFYNRNKQDIYSSYSSVISKINSDQEKDT